MIYQFYQAYQAMTDPIRAFAGAWQRDAFALRAEAGERPGAVLAEAAGAWRATFEMVELAGLTHARPRFGLQSVVAGGHEAAVVEQVALESPFGSLLRFSVQGAAKRPRVLLVSPMSGHYATLLRGTLRTLLADHDVYVTDWHNARDVPPELGRFGLDEYVRLLVRFLETIGAGAHVVAVCQGTVPSLAAAALMAEDGHRATPRSLTLIAGPIDARIDPTRVNRFTARCPIGWFEQNMTDRVPARYAGAGRRVHPGFVQLGASMAMTLEQHVKAFADLYLDRLRGDDTEADAIRHRYVEYFATMDLPAEFYLDTIDRVFQRHALARGEFRVGERRVDPAALRRTALLTVAGERDEVCPPGQTLAAQALCASLPARLRRHHVQPGADHYGTFGGRTWEEGVFPLVREMTHRFG